MGGVGGFAPHRKNMDLHEQLWDWDNLLLAYENAARGKRGKADVARFEYGLMDELIALQGELRSRTYRPGSYHSFYIHEPKRRLISAAAFRDRVVHHALCNVTVPYFERRFIADSYANRPRKGTHRALDRCQQFARRFRYVLQCDVEQYFPAIDHALLRQALMRLLPRQAEADLGWLIDRIIASGQGVQAEAYEMRYFPGDDLFASQRPRGLPIGNLTSQWWANAYLNDFDHFVKRDASTRAQEAQQGCRGYVRYVDDFLLFGDDKRRLQEWRERVIERLAELRLTIHEAQAHVRPVTEGIPFLGFIVFPTHRRLKRRKGIAFQRRLARLVQVSSAAAIKPIVQGWLNHVRYGDTHGLRRAMLSRFDLLYGN